MTSKKPKGLGLGLEALLGPKLAESQSTTAGAPSSLKLSQLQPGRYQPRTRMDEGSLYELAESIKSQGVMQPVLVRQLKPNEYEIIAGERRVRAARLAGLTEIPVLVRNVPDESAAVMALIENIQREDLGPLEEAHGLRRLIDEFKLSHEQAAQAVGRSRSAASNLLRLLNLAQPVQNLLQAGDIDMGHARALLSLQSTDQIMVANQVASKRLSVRQAEALANRLLTRKTAAARSTAKAQSADRDLARLQEKLSDHLGTAVEVRLRTRRKGAQSGEVALAFHSLDELDGLLAKLGLQDG